MYGCEGVKDTRGTTTAPRCPINEHLGAYLLGWLHLVITISVMPPFTYPNLSLYGHGVITVL
jgi:hypothetical protein